MQCFTKSALPWPVTVRQQYICTPTLLYISWPDSSGEEPSGQVRFYWPIDNVFHKNNLLLVEEWQYMAYPSMFMERSVSCYHTHTPYCHLMFVSLHFSLSSFIILNFHCFGIRWKKDSYFPVLYLLPLRQHSARVYVIQSNRIWLDKHAGKPADNDPRYQFFSFKKINKK